MLDRQRKARQTKLFTLAGIGVVALAFMGFLIWQNVNASSGGNVAVEATEGPVLTADYIEEGSNPGEYSTDPPTGGVHYPSTLPAKFYEEADVAALGDYPHAHLVHNLEHGHVILWYNCDLLDADACAQTKTQIQNVLDAFNGFKVLAYPWKTLDVPVVITSWGRTYPMETFDPAIAQALQAMKCPFAALA